MCDKFDHGGIVPLHGYDKFRDFVFKNPDHPIIRIEHRNIGSGLELDRSFR